MKNLVTLTILIGTLLTLNACSFVRNVKQDPSIDSTSEGANAESVVAEEAVLISPESPTLEVDDPNGETGPSVTAHDASGASIIIGGKQSSHPLTYSSDSKNQSQGNSSQNNPSDDQETNGDQAKGGGKAGKWVSYTVKNGDTLMKIAFETYADVYRWKDILNANRSKVKNSAALSKGTVLKIQMPSPAVSIQRNGEKYLIKKGTTLGKISNEVYGATRFWRKLWENNKQLIRNPNMIFAGFWLYYLPLTKEKTK